jgi:hypothetical protein
VCGSPGNFTNAWNGVVSQSGENVTITNESYNATIGRVGAGRAVDGRTRPGGGSGGRRGGRRRVAIGRGPGGNGGAAAHGDADRQHQGQGGEGTVSHDHGC